MKKIGIIGAGISGLFIANLFKKNPKYQVSIFDKKKSLNFESTLSEIEKIIESLEEGNLSLEDSIKAYEKGISLTKACQKMLSDAELKIKKLSSKEGEDVSFEDISND